MLKIICEMSGKETALPCSASGCPLFGDCISKYRQLTQKPQTHADRIRAMSDEKLAQFIPNWSYTKACKCDEQSYVDCNNECEKCVAEWLQQPAEEVNE